ncbi:ADP-ribosylation factor-like protein 6-interacting protein 6 [Dunckerocampus dactyliophorus]|uniref:ADP-ribosylation factor-like protein 6-interacting protein 6 n=1 Tax=Dunckerocampus dactyliophorus TaxID=161453 RepID=UPI0024057621|nr:ADP-ribosylation factor-like protein 6-interacting protein 6 [Dunckerocampus dactyliophorus]
MEHLSHTGTVGGVGGSVKFKLWPEMLLSVLVSAAAVVAVGVFCAFLDPILQVWTVAELRAERVIEEDGTEVRMLAGFWSILVLSLLAGSICCFFSWTVAYLNSYKAGIVPPTVTLLCRDTLEQGFLVDYGVAILNGVMASLTVIWSMT